jgi:hypothetical protein
LAEDAKDEVVFHLARFQGRPMKIDKFGDIHEDTPTSAQPLSPRAAAARKRLRATAFQSSLSRARAP